jgi:hypothetical protein
MLSAGASTHSLVTFEKIDLQAGERHVRKRFCVPVISFAAVHEISIPDGAVMLSPPLFG